MSIGNCSLAVTNGVQYSVAAAFSPQPIETQKGAFKKEFA
jgi:hypothetical protein